VSKLKAGSSRRGPTSAKSSAQASHSQYVSIFIDLFRSHDLSGWAKTLWFIFILLLPLIGVLVYLIARGGKMHEH
jgi:hypothetical protein